MLLFGAKKLPELARGSGRALRIFKAETKGLMDDDDDDDDAKTATRAQLGRSTPSARPRGRAAPRAARSTTPRPTPPSDPRTRTHPCALDGRRRALPRPAAPPRRATTAGWPSSDHLRELRARILKSVTVILIGTIVALFFFDQIFELILKPYKDAQAALAAPT